MSRNLSEITEEYAQLTKHPKGSVKEMWHISFPLMLSALSGNLMVFFDRLILANYSLEGMGAAAAAGITCMIFMYGAIGVSSIAEVFVAQYNGERKYKEAAGPTWQMLWFSAFSGVIFIAIALWGGPFLVSDYHYLEYGYPYFKWLMLFGATFPAQAALSSFFIGIGHVRIVTLTAVTANVINILLDLILVFGIKGLTPSYGVKGAAIATGLAQLFQVLFLLAIFLNKENRKKYHTYRYTFQRDLFSKCLRIGFPSAAGHMIEISAWAVMTQLMIAVSELHLIATIVGQTFYGLIAFAMEGIQKGVTTIAANFIGSGDWKMVNNCWYAAAKMLLILAGVFSLVMVVYPDPLIKLFIPEELKTASESEVIGVLRVVAFFVWVYFIFDGMTWISAGVLTAAGDTLFIMLMNAFGAWFFALMPVYILVYKYHLSPTNSWMLIAFYGMMNSICFYVRYKLGGWKKRQKLTS